MEKPEMYKVLSFNEVDQLVDKIKASAETASEKVKQKITKNIMPKLEGDSSPWIQRWLDQNKYYWNRYCTDPSPETQEELASDAELMFLKDLSPDERKELYFIMYGEKID
jgi:hypothetical protein